MPRKKLLILPALFPSPGDELKGIFVLDYLKCVQQHYDITVLHFTLFGKQRMKEELYEGFKLSRYSYATPTRINKKMKLLLYPLYLKMMIRIIKEHINFGVNIIHAHGTFLQGYAASKAIEQKKIPLVITEHTGPFSKLTKNKHIRRIVSKAIDRADCLLTVSEDLRLQILDAGMKPKKTVVTYNPVDTDLFALGEGVAKSSRKNIVFAGRLEDYKGALKSLEAFDQIRSTFPGWKLTIIGDGPEMPHIKERLDRDKGLKSLVVCTGQLNKQELADEFKRASFLVFPSAHETFGLVIAEAMSAGLPVVVGNQTAPKEFVSDVCGLLVDPYDIAQLARAMKKMMETVDQYNSHEIRKSVIHRFGFKSFGEILSTIYNSI